MKLHQIALAACLGAASLAPAHAIVQVDTTGLTTTYTETFDGGTSFTGNAWFDSPSSDDYLWLTNANPTATYTFSSAVAIATLGLSFWYSVPNSDSGSVSLVTLTNLGDTPGNGLQFLANNPGASAGGLLGTNNHDAFFSNTLTDLAAGSYTLTFSQLGGALNALKIDDVSISVTAVPEPETYALMFAGLALVGFIANRRRPNRD